MKYIQKFKTIKYCKIISLQLVDVCKLVRLRFYSLF